MVFQAAGTACAKALRQEGAEGSEELNEARGTVACKPERDWAGRGLSAFKGKEREQKP